MSLPKLPDPYTTALRIREAIQQNHRPAALLHDFLTSGNMSANFVANTLIDYKAAILYLSSPQGKAYLHKWLDDTLNYLGKWAESSQ